MQTALKKRVKSKVNTLEVSLQNIYSELPTSELINRLYKMQAEISNAVSVQDAEATAKKMIRRELNKRGADY
jgi:hypothetical protein